MSSFFAKSLARYLIVTDYCLVTCILGNDSLVISFSVQRKSMVKVFGQKLRFFFQKSWKIFQKTQNTIRFGIN